MSFMDAVKSALTNYVGFSGRARRSEFWLYNLFCVIVGVAASIVGSVFVSFLLVPLALLLPGFAITVRRLHDIGKSGWMILVALVPLVGPIILLVLFCLDSQPGQNAYGANPKGVAGAAPLASVRAQGHHCPSCQQPVAPATGYCQTCGAVVTEQA